MHLERPKTLIYVATEDWYFWLHRLAVGRAALAAGWRVIVACRVQAHGERLAAEGFIVLPLPWRRGGGTLKGELGTLVMLWRLFRRERPDLVHLYALKAILYGGLAARLAGVRRRIGTIAGLGYVFTASRLKARLLRLPVLLALRIALGGRGSLVTLENPDDGRLLAGRGVIDPGQIALIASCGVDVGVFHPAPEPEGVPIVAMACRLVRDKGVGLAVEAVRRLRRQGVAVRFRLAGAVDPDNPDSHTVDEVAAWVAEGLVEPAGYITDVARFWREAHIAVYPSRYGEGLPKTLLEAAASGRPAVTTDAPGCREAVADGVTGFLVPLDDADATADRLRRLVEDPALRRRMGEAARARVVERFSDEVVVKGFLGVYDGA